MPTHGATEGLNDLEYVTAYTYAAPHQSHRVSIGQDDVVQKIGELETKVASFRNVKRNRVGALVEATFPEADGWTVPRADLAKVVEESSGLDLWHFSLTGTRYVAA